MLPILIWGLAIHFRCVHLMRRLHLDFNLFSDHLQHTRASMLPVWKEPDERATSCVARRERRDATSRAAHVLRLILNWPPDRALAESTASLVFPPPAGLGNAEKQPKWSTVLPGTTPVRGDHAIRRGLAAQGAQRHLPLTPRPWCRFWTSRNSAGSGMLKEGSR